MDRFTPSFLTTNAIRSSTRCAAHLQLHSDNICPPEPHQVADAVQHLLEVVVVLLAVVVVLEEAHLLALRVSLII